MLLAVIWGSAFEWPRYLFLGGVGPFVSGRCLTVSDVFVTIVPLVMPYWLTLSVCLALVLGMQAEGGGTSEAGYKGQEDGCEAEAGGATGPHCDIILQRFFCALLARQRASRWT